MSTRMWLLFSILALIAGIALVVLLFIRNYLKNTYYHNYQKDELIKVTETTNSINALHFASGETTRFIDKYVLCESMYDKFIVCNYLKPYKKISYFIYCYNKKGKVISIVKFQEKNTNNSSRIIALHRKTNSVNIVINMVDNIVLNSNCIRPLSNKRIRLFSLVFSAALFLILFAFRQFLFMALCSSSLRELLNSIYNYASVLFIFGISVFTYIFTILRLRKKNVKALSGGVQEYEFI